MIARAFAEAKSEEEQHGGALPRLEGFSLCEVGWALKSHICLSLPHTATEMDLRLCEFVEHAWEEGDARNIPADARSGLMHFIDAPRGHLPGSQRLLLAWSRSFADQSFACHGRRCASTKIARRVVTFDRSPRSPENHRNHLHPSITLHLPGTVSVAEVSALPTQQRAIDRLARKARHPLFDAARL